MRTTIEKRIEILIAREIYLNQSTLIFKLNLGWIDYIENYYDESSETVEEYLIYETDIEDYIISGKNLTCTNAWI